MKRLLPIVLCTACISTTQQKKNEFAERPLGASARVAVIELGWDSIEDQNPLHPPVVDKLAPRRYKGLVTTEANDLADQCNAGQQTFAELRRKSSSQSEIAMVTVEQQSKEPYRDAALRLQVGECTAVDGPTAEYVVKRLE